MKKLIKLMLVLLIVLGMLAIAPNVKAETRTYTIGYSGTPVDETIFSTGIVQKWVVTFESKISATTERPVLTIKIGNGEAKTVTVDTVTSNTITYKYTLTAEDKGLIQLVSYVGTVTLADGTTENVSFTSTDGAFDDSIKVYANQKESAGTEGGSGTGEGTGSEEEGSGSGAGTGSGTGAGAGTGEATLTWSDKTKVKFGKKLDTTGHFGYYTLTVKNLTETEGITRYYYISNTDNITIQYDEAGYPINYTGSTTNTKSDTGIIISKYLQNKSKVYVTLVEGQYVTGQGEKTEIIAKDVEITKPDYRPVGQRMQGYFFNEDTSLFVYEPIFHDWKGKIDIKVGVVNDTTILKNIKNKTGNCLEELLKYAKKEQAIYTHTFTLESATDTEFEAVAKDMKLENDKYYFVYMKINDEDTIALEDVSLYQAMVVTDEGKTEYNLSDYLSDKFEWNLKEAPTTTEDPTTMKNQKLPQTGQTIIVMIFGVMILAGGIIFAVKSKKYKI